MQLIGIEEFVTKILSILKVDKEEIPNYRLHVAQLVRVALPCYMLHDTSTLDLYIQRKFCRIELSSRSTGTGRRW